MMKIKGSIFFLLCVASATNAHYSPLKTEFEWKYFDYYWKSPEHKQAYLDNGDYDYKAMAPIDVDRSPDGRTFVTVIGGKGVPATVHTVSNKQTEHGPLLQPYPSWSWYESNDCSKNISNVYRVAIDRCNRVWILDTGLLNGQRVCPAKLLAFNLHNDKLIFNRAIPDNVAQNQLGQGQLITPIVETSGHYCEDTTVYMADVAGSGLVMFDGKDFFRVDSNVYGPEDEHVNFTIAGESFTLPDGVLGMALSPPQHPYGGRSLYFRPLASLSVYSAETKNLKNSKHNGGKTVNYKKGTDVLPSQASAMAFSKEGTLFFGMTKEIAIGCWNMHRELKPWNIKIAVADQERLQFASGMKVVSTFNRFSHHYSHRFSKEEEVMVMTNRLQKIYNGTQNFNETNFRILRASVSDLIGGTICDYKK